MARALPVKRSDFGLGNSTDRVHQPGGGSEGMTAYGTFQASFDVCFPVAIGLTTDMPLQREIGRW